MPGHDIIYVEGGDRPSRIGPPGAGGAGDADMDGMAWMAAGADAAMDADAIRAAMARAYGPDAIGRIEPDGDPGCWMIEMAEPSRMAIEVAGYTRIDAPGGGWVSIEMP